MIDFESLFRPGTIMNRTVHMGIVLAVVVHMAAGCCLHHAHAHGRSSGRKALAVEASCPRHHGSGGPDRSCHHPSHPKQCDEDKCVFARPDSDDTPDLSIGHGCLNPVCVSPGLSTLSGIDRADSSLGELRPPIPLHLLNQVLLI